MSNKKSKVDFSVYQDQKSLMVQLLMRGENKPLSPEIIKHFFACSDSDAKRLFSMCRLEGVAIKSGDAYVTSSFGESSKVRKSLKAAVREHAASIREQSRNK